MSVTIRPLSPAAYLPTSDTTLYTASANMRAYLDKVTAYNSDTSVATAAFHLVPNGGAVAASNRVVFKTLAAGETYTFPELVGHVLESGGSLSGIAGTADKVVVRVSGREVT